MIYIFCGVLLLVLIFHQILAPICYFLERYQLVVFLICAVVLIWYCVNRAKKFGRPGYGFGAFFAISQFLVFALAAVYGIVDTLVTETDAILAMFMAIIVALVFGAYGCFNLGMLHSALDEGKEKPGYLWTVGTVGWGINILFTVLS